jgi:hypothetical protein
MPIGRNSADSFQEVLPAPKVPDAPTPVPLTSALHRQATQQQRKQNRGRDFERLVFCPFADGHVFGVPHRLCCHWNGDASINGGLGRLLLWTKRPFTLICVSDGRPGLRFCSPSEPYPVRFFPSASARFVGRRKADRRIELRLLRPLRDRLPLQRTHGKVDARGGRLHEWAAEAGVEWDRYHQGH